jgi:hypothetical protein
MARRALLWLEDPLLTRARAVLPRAGARAVLHAPGSAPPFDAAGISDRSQWRGCGREASLGPASMARSLTSSVARPPTASAPCSRGAPGARRMRSIRSVGSQSSRTSATGRLSGTDPFERRGSRTGYMGSICHESPVDVPLVRHGLVSVGLNRPRSIQSNTPEPGAPAAKRSRGREALARLPRHPRRAPGGLPRPLAKGCRPRRLHRPGFTRRVF